MQDFGIKAVDLDGGYYDYDISFFKTESFAQKVLLLLNTWKTEFVYDVTKGIDYHSILQGKYSARSLEAYFIYELKNQMETFDYFDNFDLDYNKELETAKISFIAYSTTGESANIENFQL